MSQRRQESDLLSATFDSMSEAWEKNPRRFLRGWLFIGMAFWSFWSLVPMGVLLVLPSERLGIGAKRTFFLLYALLGAGLAFWVWRSPHVIHTYTYSPHNFLMTPRPVLQQATRETGHFLRFVILQNWYVLKATFYPFNGSVLLTQLQHYGYPLIGVSALWGACLFMLLGVIQSPHERELRRMQRGKLVSTSAPRQPVTKRYQKRASRWQRRQAAVSPQTATGAGVDQLIETGIGVDVMSRKPVILDEAYLNQVILCLGTTGAGKTYTLSHFYYRAIARREPTIIIDGKPDLRKIQRLKQYAAAKGVPFYPFGCDARVSYDFLNHGSPTEIKDKIIALKDDADWDSDYYRSQAEAYLQTAIEILRAKSGRLTLDALIDSLDTGFMGNHLRKVGEVALQKKIQRVIEIEKKDLQGIQNQLTLLINSDLGETINGHGVSLRDVVREQGVIYFALNKLKYPVFSTVFGKVVINDIKTLLAENEQRPVKVNLFFDEFSAFAGEQVLNLVNMGRGYGAHTVLGTQGLDDLKSIRHQLLNNANTLLVHRLNGQDAEEVAQWLGTKDTYNLTAQIDTGDMGRSNTGQGSVRQVKAFYYHPDTIKELPTGTFILGSKVHGVERRTVQAFNVLADDEEETRCF